MHIQYPTNYGENSINCIFYRFPIKRLQQVDMVVLYVLSTQSAVFELMRLYEQSGILRLRTSLKMPFDEIDGPGFKPSSETEWNDEAIEFNVCLIIVVKSKHFFAIK